MKNLMNKIRKANKGFTLVELIIVIAVIAVLSAVVAPQYIKYVERSRQGVDASTLQEVKHIVEIEAGTTDALQESSVSIASNGAVTGTGSFADGTDAIKNVKGTIGTIAFKSSNTTAAAPYVLKVTATGAVSWSDGTGASGTPLADNTAPDIAALQKGTLGASSSKKGILSDEVNGICC